MPFRVDFFYNGWETLVRILIVGTLAYLALAISLRLAGKRVLARMDSFDFVGNVALGSTLAAIVLTPSISVAEGLVAYVVLVGIPVAINYISSRSPSIRTLLNGEPTLLMFNGHFINHALKIARVSRDEIMEAIRKDGFGAIEDVHAVVLEIDGHFSVVGKKVPTTGTAIKDVLDNPPTP